MTDPVEAPGHAAETVQLRPAEPTDALCLSVLAMQVFLDTYATGGIRPTVAREVLSTYSVAAFEATLRQPQSRVVVAERDGHLVGFAELTLGAAHPLAPAGVPAELLRLYVQEPFTGIGLGTRLLARAEQLAAEAGAEVLWLTPWVHNHRARAFYARRGFQDHGLTWFTFEGESHENRVLAKALAMVVAEAPVAPASP
jgi:diamine N-acetyltransferase